METEVTWVAGLVTAIFFAVLSWRRSVFAAACIVFLSPLYLVRIREGLFATNLLDILLAAWCIAFFVRTLWEKKKIAIPSWGGAAALIAFGAGLAAVVAESSLQLRALGETKSIIVLPVLFAVGLWNTVKEEHDKKILLQAISFSAAAQSAIALLGALLTDGFITYDMRLRGFFASPNQFAMILAPACVIAFGLFLSEQNKKMRHAYVIALALCLFGLVFTQSLGGIISAISGGLFYLWATRRISRKMFILISVISIISAISALLLFDIGSRSPLSSRLMVWRTAWEILKGHWFFGIGFGTFQQYYLSLQEKFPSYLEWAVPHPHNVFFAAWLATGALGLLGFLWFLFEIIKRALHALSLPAKDPLLLAVFCSLISIIAHGLIDTTILKNDLAVTFWVLVAIF